MICTIIQMLVLILEKIKMEKFQFQIYLLLKFVKCKKQFSF